MAVHYKFKSTLFYETVTFDALHISVRDLKIAIMEQKKIGRICSFDLQISNAQSKEVYNDDEELIPKNTSVIIARIPKIVNGVDVSSNKKYWKRQSGKPFPADDDKLSGKVNLDNVIKTADLLNIDATEEEKVKIMISQSSQEYGISRYVKSRNVRGPVPPNYTCYRCGRQGHWIYDCPTKNVHVKRSTGIPRSFMVPVDGPEHKGALLTSSGEYAVPLIDHVAYKEKKEEKSSVVNAAEPEIESKAQPPDELLCSVCRNLLEDAVLIPCCGNSSCDECVRQELVDSDNHECPVCHKTDVSPDSLIPNRFLRAAVENFKNEIGSTKIKQVTSTPYSQSSHTDSTELSPDCTVENQVAPTEPVVEEKDIVQVRSVVPNTTVSATETAEAECNEIQELSEQSPDSEPQMPRTYPPPENCAYGSEPQSVIDQTSCMQYRGYNSYEVPNATPTYGLINHKHGGESMPYPPPVSHGCTSEYRPEQSSVIGSTSSIQYQGYNSHGAPCFIPTYELISQKHNPEPMPYPPPVSHLYASDYHLQQPPAISHVYDNRYQEYDSYQRTYEPWNTQFNIPYYELLRRGEEVPLRVPSWSHNRRRDYKSGYQMNESRNRRQRMQNLKVLTAGHDEVKIPYESEIKEERPVKKLEGESLNKLKKGHHRSCGIVKSASECKEHQPTRYLSNEERSELLDSENRPKRLANVVKKLPDKQVAVKPRLKSVVHVPENSTLYRTVSTAQTQKHRHEKHNAVPVLNSENLKSSKEDNMHDGKSKRKRSKDTRDDHRLPKRRAISQDSNCFERSYKVTEKSDLRVKMDRSDDRGKQNGSSRRNSSSISGNDLGGLKKDEPVAHATPNFNEPQSSKVKHVSHEAKKRDSARRRLPYQNESDSPVSEGERNVYEDERKHKHKRKHNKHQNK